MTKGLKTTNEVQSPLLTGIKQGQKITHLRQQYLVGCRLGYLF